MSSTGGGVIIAHNSVSEAVEITSVTVNGVEVSVPPDDPIYGPLLDKYRAAVGTSTTES